VRLKKKKTFIVEDEPWWASLLRLASGMKKEG
jgi:hypothetical protein